MKRFLAIALCCIMLLALAACDAEEKDASKSAGKAANEAANEDTGSNKVGNTMSYNITKVYVNKDLTPENTDGYHKYYEALEGNTLFIVEMDVTNITEDLYRIWTLAELKLTIADEEYEATIAVDLGQEDSFGNGNVEINKDETYHVFYMFEIPEEVANENAVLSITSNEQTKTIDVMAE